MIDRQFAGHGVASRTWQLLESSFRDIEAFDVTACEQIAASLRKRLA